MLNSYLFEPLIGKNTFWHAIFIYTPQFYSIKNQCIVPPKCKKPNLKEGKGKVTNPIQQKYTTIILNTFRCEGKME